MFKSSLNHSNCWLIKKINYYLLSLKKIWGWFFLYLLKFYKKYFFIIDSWLYEKQVKYIHTIHLNNSFLWKIKNYFGPFNPYCLDYWIVGDRYFSLYFFKAFWFF